MSGRERILAVVPLPPPWAGVEQMSRLLVESHLSVLFDLDVLKSNVRDVNADKGRMDLAGISRVLSIALRLFVRLLIRRPRLVYLTISQNLSGLLRDCLYISMCMIVGVPVVGHLHGSALHLFLERHSGSRLFFLFFLRRLRQLVVVGNSIKTDLVSWFPPEKISVVYNACEATREYTVNRTNGMTVAFMGHLSAAKGFYDLMEAAERVWKNHPEARFVIAGERVDNERNVPAEALAGKKMKCWSDVESLVKQNPGKIDFVGVRTGVEKTMFLKNADLFVFPSHMEAFPLAVLEAMEAGLPLITSQVGALPEILHDKENTLFIHPGDVQRLAEAMLELINNPSVRMKMSDANRVLARDFTVKRAAAAMETVFRKAIKNP